MNGSLVYIGINILIVIMGIVSFQGWGFVSAGLAGLNAYGQYVIMKNGGGK